MSVYSFISGKTWKIETFIPLTFASTPWLLSRTLPRVRIYTDVPLRPFPPSELEPQRLKLSFSRSLALLPFASLLCRSKMERTKGTKNKPRSKKKEKIFSPRKPRGKLERSGRYAARGQCMLRCSIHCTQLYVILYIQHITMRSGIHRYIISVIICTDGTYVFIVVCTYCAYCRTTCSS